ncbi:hypothetical protein [Halomarina ordinaria]|uniref:DUF58 domain-containing protein n=1 Tax=Halomarina ordinaria TaxID=3033939 RepID=A0ABD5U5T8_9EURY|nr:hypothetical protein [Halomarina sp. PSRA2]
MRTTRPLSGRTGSATPTPPTVPDARAVLVAFAVALVIPAVLLVVSYPLLAALVATGFLAGVLTVTLASGLARRRAGRGGAAVRVPGTDVRLRV